jgi:uncharacterized membrane protein
MAAALSDPLAWACAAAGGMIALVLWLVATVVVDLLSRRVFRQPARFDVGWLLLLLLLVWLGGVLGWALAGLAGAA